MPRDAIVSRNSSDENSEDPLGWMLREVGNRDRKTEVKWLNARYQRMRRTMLRYAIEKFPERLRQDYLKGRVSKTRR